MVPRILEGVFLAEPSCLSRVFVVLHGLIVSFGSRSLSYGWTNVLRGPPLEVERAFMCPGTHEARARSTCAILLSGGAGV